MAVKYIDTQKGKPYKYPMGVYYESGKKKNYWPFAKD